MTGKRLSKAAKSRRRVSAVAFCAAVVLIIILNIWLRSGLLQFQGFFEPDGFFYYAAVKQAIANGLVVAKTVTLSGYPWHNNLNEAPGLLYTVLLPYALLHPLGVSAYDIMRAVPILFGLIIAAGAYFLAKRIHNSRALGLLAMFLVSISSGNIARTAGTVFRGDTFISAFSIAVLLVLFVLLRARGWMKRLACLGCAALLMGVGQVVWNGGVFVLAVYLSAIALIMAYAFLAADYELTKMMPFATMAVIFAYALNVLFVYLGMGNFFLTMPSTLPLYLNEGIYMLTILLPLFAVQCIGIILLSDGLRKGVSSTLVKRLALLVVVLAASAALAYLALGGNLFNVLTDYEVSSGGGKAIAATISELQSPSIGFLVSSFGIQIPAALIGLAMFLLLRSMKHGEGGFVPNEDLRWSSTAFAGVVGYLILTVFLQLGATRYNALLSVPLAVLAAYGIYALGAFILERNRKMRSGLLRDMRAFNMYMGFITAIFILQFSIAAAQSISSVQADSINPGFLQAMTWLSNNTAPNATVLTLWPDGSVVEGWGDRTSFEDSVGGDNTTRTVGFANFLGNTSPDTQFLYNFAHRPDYLIVRMPWLLELGGILTEGNSTELLETGYYGIANLQQTSQNASGGAMRYTYSDGQYSVNLTIGGLRHGNVSVVGEASIYNGSQQSQISHIFLVNALSGDTSVFNYTGGGTQGYTLVVAYGNGEAAGATVLDPQFSESNLFKLLGECGQGSCAYDNRNATLTQVYANQDTRIFRIGYFAANESGYG